MRAPFDQEQFVAPAALARSVRGLAPARHPPYRRPRRRRSRRPQKWRDSSREDFEAPSLVSGWTPRSPSWTRSSLSTTTTRAARRGRVAVATTPWHNAQRRRRRRAQSARTTARLRGRWRQQSRLGTTRWWLPPRTTTPAASRSGAATFTERTHSKLGFRRAAARFVANRSSSRECSRRETWRSGARKVPCNATVAEAVRAIAVASLAAAGVTCRTRATRGAPRTSPRSPRLAVIEAIAAGDGATRTYEGYALQNLLGEVMNRANGVGWTSRAHTGVDVPVFAHGVGAEAFRGSHDNFRVRRMMIDALGIGPGGGVQDVPGQAIARRRGPSFVNSAV